MKAAVTQKDYVLLRGCHDRASLPCPLQCWRATVKVTTHRGAKRTSVRNGSTELYGPGVDAACGAEESACGDWEAGARYPSFVQLLALATLTHQSPDSFIAREGDEDLDLRDAMMWCHISKAEQPRWRPPITEFTAGPSKNVPAPTITATPTCSEVLLLPGGA